MDAVKFTRLVQGWYSETDPAKLDAMVSALSAHNLEGWQPYIRHRITAKRKGLIPRKGRRQAA